MEFSKKYLLINLKEKCFWKPTQHLQSAIHLWVSAFSPSITFFAACEDISVECMPEMLAAIALLTKLLVHSKSSMHLIRCHIQGHHCHSCSCHVKRMSASTSLFSYAFGFLFLLSVALCVPPPMQLSDADRIGTQCCGLLVSVEWRELAFNQREQGKWFMFTTIFLHCVYSKLNKGLWTI